MSAALLTITGLLWNIQLAALRSRTRSGTPPGYF
jgi:hypothetical protein